MELQKKFKERGFIILEDLLKTEECELYKNLLERDFVDSSFIGLLISVCESGFTSFSSKSSQLSINTSFYWQASHSSSSIVLGLFTATAAWTLFNSEFDIVDFSDVVAPLDLK